ncbi:MAG TPA: AAA family ATPase [Streptosporangiaceae bacterium]|nr:AAA family ATPase [Streptosporangiaceae bacterium]
MTGTRPGVFVGRKSETVLCREVLSQVIHGRGRVLVIDGEPGIGKSSQLGVLLRMARSCDCTVLLGHADDLSQQFPMRVMLDCLGGAFAAADPRQAELAGLTGDPGPAGRSAVLVQRVLDLVAQLCARSPVVLAIDDLHWADDDSLLAWRRLTEVTPDLPLLLVATWCPVPHRAELTTLKQQLVAREQALISLGPLAAEEVTELVGILAGGEPTARLSRLTERAGGNPLYVTELVDALVRSERLQVADGTADIVTGQEPRAVATAISERLNFLSAETNRMLRFAALLGRNFSAAEVAAVADRTPEQLAPTLSEAQAARVVAEADGRLNFRHLLIRQALYDSMPGALRLALHRQAAQSLAEAGAAAERVAEQLLATTALETNPWVWDWLAGAAPRLVRRAPQMAAELFRRAMSDASPDDHHRDLLEGALAAALLRLNRCHEAVDVARPLLARTRDAPRRAETVRVLGHALLGCGQPGEALRVVENVLADPALSSRWRARLRAVVALIHVLAGRLYDADVVAHWALAEGQHAGDRYAVGHALHVLSLVRTHRSDHTAVEKLASQALATLGDEPEAADLRCALLLSRMLARQQLGRMTEAGVDLRTAQDLTGQGDVPEPLAHAAAEYYLRIGQWDDALDQLAGINGSTALPDHLGRAGLPWYDGSAGHPGPAGDDPLWHGISALIAGHRDDRTVAAAHLKAARSEAPEVATQAHQGHAAYLILGRALAAERDGRVREAVTMLQPALATDDVAASGRLRSLWLPTLVRLALECGEPDLAKAAAGVSEQVASHEMTAVNEATAGHCRGLVARDPVPLLAAARTYRLIGVPLEQAQASEDAAELLAAAGETAQARRSLAEAVGGYASLGAEWDIRRADTRLRRYGIRRGRSRPRTSGRGWDSLTPAEIKIAQLISLGSSTPDIARDLLLSPRTVQTHVSHILRKLDGRSRVDIVRASIAAGAAAEAPPPDP